MPTAAPGVDSTAKRCRLRRPRVGLAERLRDLPAVVPRQHERGIPHHLHGQAEHPPRGSGDLALGNVENMGQLFDVCVCVFIRCARCRSDSAAGGRDRVSATATSPAGHRSPTGATRISIWTDQSTRCAASRRPKKATRRGPAASRSRLADRGGPRRNRGTRATPRETMVAVRAPGQDGDVGGLSLTSV